MRLPAAVLALLALLAPTVTFAQADSGPRAQLFGFTDFNYRVSEAQASQLRGQQDGFYEGQLVGHAIGSLSEHLSFFGEVSATALTTGFNVEVERAILRYDFSDDFKLSAGRYHTPINYWNMAFHHGQWLQTTVARPELIKFGGRFLPVHFVGLLAEGEIPTGALGLGYTAAVGNGRHTNIARGGDAGDINRHRAWMAGVRARPAALFGLQVGGSVYFDRVPNTAGAEFDERIWTAHVVWEKETPEALAEYARVRHEPRTGGGSFESEGYYIQLAYRLPGAASAFKPYARVERVRTPFDEPIFGGSRLNYDARVAGVRFDFSSFVALKAEYRSERFQLAAPTRSDRLGSLFVQASLTITGGAGGGEAPTVTASGKNEPQRSSN